MPEISEEKTKSKSGTKNSKSKSEKKASPTKEHSMTKSQGTLSKRAKRHLESVTPFKPGKFVNLDPQGIKLMGQEHVIEPRLDVTGKNTQMTEVVA